MQERKTPTIWSVFFIMLAFCDSAPKGRWTVEDGGGGNSPPIHRWRDWRGIIRAFKRY